MFEVGKRKRGLPTRWGQLPARGVGRVGGYEEEAVERGAGLEDREGVRPSASGEEMAHD